MVALRVQLVSSSLNSPSFFPFLSFLPVLCSSGRLMISFPLTIRVPHKGMKDPPLSFSVFSLFLGKEKDGMTKWYLEGLWCGTYIPPTSTKKIWSEYFLVSCRYHFEAGFELYMNLEQASLIAWTCQSESGVWKRISGRTLEDWVWESQTPSLLDPLLRIKIGFSFFIPFSLPPPPLFLFFSFFLLYHIKGVSLLSTVSIYIRILS